MVRSQAYGFDLTLQDFAELPPLIPSELLGRGVFSEKRARKASTRGIIAHNEFLESIDRDNLSVDRLGFAPDLEMAEIADRNAAGRRQTFFGWAVVTVQQASEMERRVEPAPLLDNRYHALIVLNLPTGVERRDVAREHALNLAKHATYQPRP
ncbi:MAG: hypothetical protein IIA00_02355 [Proteobacteria bacterium]|nr:hypothetical protein [Pseudomonadota bacterium]